MKYTQLLCCLLICGSMLTGCATAPENISPAYTSHMTYMQFSVEQLMQEEARLEKALTESSAAQRTARTNDTVGVIFLGLPVSSLSGSNQAHHIARLKGELEAVRKAIIEKGGRGKL
jgi:starvation-inducible outer membrane lipoprotein